MNRELTKSILTSYLVGAPIGILTIVGTILAPLLLTGEGLTSISIIGGYGISTIGLVISFLIALWIGGKMAYESAKKEKSHLSISFKYSLIVNLIIWTTFCLIIGLTSESKKFLMMIPALLALVVCTIITTFTIGLLISYLVKRIINNSDGQKNTVANKA